MKAHKVKSQTAIGLERQWTKKLQDQAATWQSARSDGRYVTNTGVSVVRLHKRKVLKEGSWSSQPVLSKGER